VPPPTPTQWQPPPLLYSHIITGGFICFLQSFSLSGGRIVSFFCFFSPTSFFFLYKFSGLIHLPVLFFRFSWEWTIMPNLPSFGRTPPPRPPPKSFFSKERITFLVSSHPFTHPGPPYFQAHSKVKKSQRTCNPFYPVQRSLYQSLFPSFSLPSFFFLQGLLVMENSIPCLNVVFPGNSGPTPVFDPTLGSHP